jgi:CTP:molybdopterin cytidylyltransferase MocA
MSPAVHVLIPAAGASARMRGRDKLLQPVWGKAILRRVAEIALATGARVFVTLPPAAEARQKALLGSLDPDRWERVQDCVDALNAIVAVAAIGAAGSGGRDGVMILPADMPAFSTGALADMISRFRAEPELIWRGGTSDGTPGHPAIFPHDLWGELGAVSGDEGGRSVLKRHSDRVRLVPLPGRMAMLDLDTPEDWAAFLDRPLPSA